MTIFIDLTGFGIIIPLLPYYALTFQADASSIGILVASFSIMQFIFSPILGRSSDKFGRRPILLLSILISFTSFILFSYAQSFLLLLLSRIIAGIATETAVAQAYIADTTSKEERASGMGKIGAAFGAGLIVGPAIGGLLSIYGFWAPGIAAAILTLINFFFVFFFLPESLRKDRSSSSPLSDSDGNLLERWEKAFRNPLIGSVLIIFFIIILAFSTIPVTVPLLGIEFFNLQAVEMSYLFMYIGVVQIVLQGFLIGRLTNKVGEEKLIVYGPLIMMVGMVVMPLISKLPIFLIAMTLMALGIGITQTTIPSFLSQKAEKGQGGMLGIAQSIASLARVPGPLIGGFIFEFAGLSAPFFISAALLFGACGLGYRVFRTYTSQR
jgi:MFS family permease